MVFLIYVALPRRSSARMCSALYARMCALLENVEKKNWRIWIVAQNFMTFLLCSMTVWILTPQFYSRFEILFLFVCLFGCLCGDHQKCAQKIVCFSIYPKNASLVSNVVMLLHFAIARRRQHRQMDIAVVAVIKCGTKCKFLGGLLFLYTNNNQQHFITHTHRHTGRKHTQDTLR